MGAKSIWRRPVRKPVAQAALKAAGRPIPCIIQVNIQPQSGAGQINKTKLCSTLVSSQHGNYP